IHFHVDAIQAITKVPKENWLTERVDFATFSAHKFHGPRGVGFIYWKKGRRLSPLLAGGGQEKGQRSGTENVPAIVAMARSLRISLEQKAQHPDHLAKIKKALLTALSQYDKVEIISPEKNCAPHIICMALKNIRGEVLVHAFEDKDIIIRSEEHTSELQSRFDLVCRLLL